MFPIVTFDTAMIQLAKSMDSPAFRVLSTALFMFLLVAYLTNWALTIWFVFKGDIFFPQVQLPAKDGEAHRERAQDSFYRSNGRAFPVPPRHDTIDDATVEVAPSDFRETTSA